MVNIKGVNSAVPGVFTDVQTVTRGVSVPVGARIAAFIGEGERQEILVSSALGGGQDGLNPDYTSISNSDGRHFKLSNYPLVEGRTKLYKNGALLVGVEQQVDSNTFSNKYDYRVDPATGEIELQTAYVVDQGGENYKASSLNVGLGSVNNITLLDPNAPTETWTVRCTSVQKDGYGNPIAETAKFIAFGSVSGVQLDGYGNSVIWLANGSYSQNATLKFNITETGAPSSVSPFREGDSFTIKVNSGALVKNDTLQAVYISSVDINDPVFLTSMEEVSLKHGTPSLSNTLSLGSQLAFQNQTPGVLAMQAAPPIPRRTSFDLLTINANSTDENEFVLPLPVGITPDTNSNINFFITNPSTGVETQVLPNKYEFYTLGTVGHPSVNTFVFDNTSYPTGYAYSYSLIKQNSTVDYNIDGYVIADSTYSNQCVFTSTSKVFTADYVGRTVRIEDAFNLANNGVFDVTGVVSGNLVLSALGTPPFVDFTSENPITFSLVNTSSEVEISGTSATDGNLVGLGGTAQATLNSTAITFNSITGIVSDSYRLKITGGSNPGLYRIISIDTFTNTITIEKTFVTEQNLKFEVIDSTTTSNYVVVNKHIVPDGHSLRVTLVTDKDASFYDAGWTTALESLEAFECDIVVPMPTSTYSNIFQNTLAHCRAMSNILNKRERVMFTGALQGLKPENLTGEKLAAVENIGVLEGIQGDTVTEVLAGNIEDLANYKVYDAFGTTFRCVYFYPDEIVVQAGTDNVKVPGFYIAAAAAGYLSGNSNVAIPLTNKVLSGFTILNDKRLSPTVLSKLVSAGVTVLQPVSGGGKVIWGRTTTNSGFPEEEEISIVFIRDRIAKSLRGGFEAFIGIAEDDNIVPSLSARAIGLLSGFISQGLIKNYQDITVKRDDVDPRQWNVTCRVQPTYPVNYIYIKVSIGLI